ncbi:UNVERIFIED_CONTAM: hypothetical protein Scaly_1041500 [Sesamum calycinum]|uniref:Pollen Ole e 1 allergen and extensin family protein n=1 Tax=Sesamum calycinum TaxID=2727403 RepID=A0AAW2QJY7_9LAMI
MASKNLLLIGLVVHAAIAVHMGEAQLGRNPKSINFDLFGVQVTLYCTPDGNMGIFGLATPPFKGADLVLQCGNKVIIATTTTNSYGIGYLIIPRAPILPFFPPQNRCKLIVNTKLSNCNATLPSIGGLESPLGSVDGNCLFGNMKVANFAATGFSYNPSL